MVVDPGRAGGEIGGSALGDEVIVEEEFDVVRCPFEGIEMEGSVDALSLREA